ncbi:F-box/WD repeat-containing protein 4 [Bactrocera dorsalis]|uniref:F-box/WD repeat-containing protein 4 n=1 Tax=Bactrocera dorsalis TaxID=27457 RepID=A0A6I9V9C1_BACDO|nr:F-box/WD repeat-containing protein 4 [Bactrocera dorsalis]
MENNQNVPTKLLDLNLDCMLRILSYCSEEDLLNLCRVHHHLRNVIDKNIFYMKTLDALMCGHRNCTRINKRSHYLSISYVSRFHIARNWLQGRYREYEYYNHIQIFPTKLLLERDILYVSHLDYLRLYGRAKHEPLQRRCLQEISTGSRGDISSFAKKQDTIFAGRVTGNCYIWEDGIVHEQQLHRAKEYLHCVDFEDEIYATSTNVCAKLWRRTSELGLVYLEPFAEMPQEYKVIKLSEGGERLYGGLYTDIERYALREFDVESGKETVLNSNTLSIYDLLIKDENVLFTGNFDTTCRMYDRRSNRDEAIFEDPFDSSFYCVEYDGLYGLLCGAKYHRRVNLYDIRMPNTYQQLYFPRRSKKARNQSSPVYSIACDNRYLFIATDQNIRVFDFKEDCAESRDYRNIFDDKRTFRTLQ